MRRICIEESSNGRTVGLDPINRGSNPRSSANVCPYSPIGRGVGFKIRMFPVRIRVWVPIKVCGMPQNWLTGWDLATEQRRNVATATCAEVWSIEYLGVAVV